MDTISTLLSHPDCQTEILGTSPAAPLVMIRLSVVDSCRKAVVFTLSVGVKNLGRNRSDCMLVIYVRLMWDVETDDTFVSYTVAPHSNGTKTFILKAGDGSSMKLPIGSGNRVRG